MRRNHYSHSAGAARRREPRRRAFSLSELIVAIGILLLMFSLAGQVFNVTMKSTSQAVALTETSQMFRAIEQSLREDLAAVRPGESLIMIQGNPVNAYWTETARQANAGGSPADGYPHFADPAREDIDGNMINPRADILMMFTARESRSYTNPEVISHRQQVVYGHAERGNWVLPPSPAPYTFEAGPVAVPTTATPAGFYPANPTIVNPAAISPIAAESWHLSRRVVHLLPTAPPVLANPLWGDGLAAFTGLGPDPLRLAQGETDVVGNFNFDEFVLARNPNMDPTDPSMRRQLPPIFGDAKPFDAPVVAFSRSQLDAAPPPQNAKQLGHYFMPHCASFKVEWTLDPRCDFVDGRLEHVNDVFWFDPGHPTDPLKSLSDAVDRAWERAAVDPLYAPVAQGLEDLLTDTAPPSAPGANDNEEYSLQERFRGTNYQGANPTGSEWTGPDGRANIVVFRAAVWRDTDPNIPPPPDAQDPDGNPVFDANSDSLVPDPIFPSALRITIDLIDGKQRLSKPMRHVMVIPVGT